MYVITYMNLKTNIIKKTNMCNSDISDIFFRNDIEYSNA